MMLAFLAPVAAEVKIAAVTPVFKRRWWYSDRRLDARPVIWSLRNHPEQWTRGFMTLVHKPSRHEFWTDFIMGYELHSSDGCGCDFMRGEAGRQTNKWQLLQWIFVGMEMSRWAAWERQQRQPERQRIADQFASHFLPKA